MWSHAQPRRRNPRRAAVAAALSLAAVAPAAAQGSGERPDALPAGPFLVQPYIRFTYEHDDNIFRRNEYSVRFVTDPDQPGMPPTEEQLPVEGDYIGTVWGGAKASLPFKMSLLELSAELSRFEYQDTPVPQDFTRDYNVAGTFNFGTGDTIKLSDHFLQGLTQVQSTVGGEGGEEVFSARPFDLNELELEISRALPGRAGYAATIRWVNLDWGESDIITAAFNYTGWDNTFEFRRPISGRRWLTFSYDWRRTDHFDPNGLRAPSDVPFRKVAFDSLLAGLRGFQSRGSPFYVQLGYGRFQYKVVESSSFRGLVGSARWRIPIGGRTKLDLTANRRVLPSNFDTYYVNNDLRAHFYREWLYGSRFGIEAWWSVNRYGDPVLEDTGQDYPEACFGKREDRRTRAEAYLSWLPVPRTTFRLGLSVDDRNSNCPVFAYDSTQLTAGISYGWD